MRCCLWVLAGFAAVWLCYLTEVSAAIRVALPAGCPAARGESSAESGFVDRLGDPRFLPRRLHSAADMQTVIQPGLEGPVVAATAINPDTLLVANYRTIQLVDLRTGAVRVLQTDLTRLDDARFIPTGIAIGPKSGKIYVANYLVNNILVGDLQAGFSIFTSNALRVDFSVARRTEEFQGQATPDVIGTAALSFSW